MKLYELGEKYLELIEQSENFDIETFNDTLEAIDDAYLDKLESTAKVIQMIDGNIGTVDSEIKRLQAKKKSMTNSKTRIKEYMQSEMERIGKDKLKGELFSFNIQNNPPSVNILDERAIPKQYFITPEPQLDKKAILSDLKNGINVLGAEQKQTKSLRIR